MAQAIERAVAAGGGIITAADVAGYAPKVFRETPQRYRGVEYVTSNDQVGYEVLNVLERFPVGEWGPGDPRFLHVLGEAFGCAFADNVTHYGDDEHTESPLAALASPAFAATRADAIRADAVLARPIDPADPWPFQSGVAAVPACPRPAAAAAPRR